MIEPSAMRDHVACLIAAAIWPMPGGHSGRLDDVWDQLSLDQQQAAQRAAEAILGRTETEAPVEATARWLLAVEAAARWLMADDSAYEIMPDVAFRTAREMLMAAGRATVPPGILLPSNEDIDTAFRHHGGSYHGPRIETATIPQAAFYEFVRSMIRMSHKAAAIRITTDE